MAGDVWPWEWLRQSRQLWKLLVLLLLLVPTGWLLGKLMFSELPGPLWTESLLGIVSFFVCGAASFGWYALAFRCPRCRGAVMWRLMKTVSHHELGQTFARLQTCPICQARILSPPGRPSDA